MFALWFKNNLNLKIPNKNSIKCLHHVLIILLCCGGGWPLNLKRTSPQPLDGLKLAMTPKAKKSMCVGTKYLVVIKLIIKYVERVWGNKCLLYLTTGLSVLGWKSINVQLIKKGSRLGHIRIYGPTYCLTSWSSVVRALVCQPSGPGSILEVSLKSAWRK